MKILTEYDWPGNVRELENAIERAIVLTENDTIEPADLLYYGLNVEDSLETGSSKNKRLVDVEKEHIMKTLRMFDGHKGKTAEVLGIDRKTLRMKLRTYGIE